MFSKYLCAYDGDNYNITSQSSVYQDLVTRDSQSDGREEVEREDEGSYSPGLF